MLDNMYQKLVQKCKKKVLKKYNFFSCIYLRSKLMEKESTTYLYISTTRVKYKWKTEVGS